MATAAASWRLVGGLSASIAAAISLGSRYGWNGALQPVTPALVGEDFLEDVNAPVPSPIAASYALWALEFLLLMLVLMPPLSLGRYPKQDQDRDGSRGERFDDDANLYEKKVSGPFAEIAPIAVGASCEDVAASSLMVVADGITSASTNSREVLPSPAFDTAVGNELVADDRMASVSLDPAIAVDALATCSANVISLSVATTSGADRNDEPSTGHESSPLAKEVAERSCASAHDDSIAMVAPPAAFAEATDAARIGWASRDKPLQIMGGYPSRAACIEASRADTDTGCSGSKEPLRGDHFKANADDFVVIATDGFDDSPSAEEDSPNTHRTFVARVMEAIRTPVTFADVTAGVRAVGDILELDTTIIDREPAAKAEPACDEAGRRGQCSGESSTNATDPSGFDGQDNSNVVAELQGVLGEYVTASTNILGLSAGEVADDPWNPLANMGMFLAQAVGLDAYENARVVPSPTVALHLHHALDDDGVNLSTAPHESRANTPIKDDISTRGVSWDARNDVGGLSRPAVDTVGEACEIVAITKELSASTLPPNDEIAVTMASANSPVELPSSSAESTEKQKTADANSDTSLAAFVSSASSHHATDDLGVAPKSPHVVSRSLQLAAESAIKDNDATRIVAPSETIADNADAKRSNTDDHWKPLHTMGTLLARAVGMEASSADEDAEETNGSSLARPALSEVFLAPSCHNRQAQTHLEKYDMFPIGSSDSCETSKETASFGGSEANADAMQSPAKVIGRWHSRSVKEEDMCDDLTTEDGAEHTDSSAKDVEASVAETREQYFPSSWLSSLRVVDKYFHGVEAVEAMDDRISVAFREQGGVVLAREFLFGTEQSPMVQAQRSACASSSSSPPWRPKASAIGGSKRRSAILTREFGAIGMQVRPRLSSGSDATGSAYDSVATSFLPAFTRGAVALHERAPNDNTIRAQSAIDSAASTTGLHMEQIAAAVAGEPEAP